MVPIRQTERFSAWIRGLKDSRGKANVIARLLRLAEGNAGDVDHVGDGVVELRIHLGPGYRVYVVRHEEEFVALIGGDKSSQERDIRKARQLARELKG